MTNANHPDYIASIRKWQPRYFQTPLLHRVITSFLFLSSLLVCLADEPGDSKGKSQFQCTIGNPKIQFTDYLKVTLTEHETLSIFGVGKAHEHLSLSLPLLRKGTFILQDTPALRLGYSRNLASSNSADHFDTHSKQPSSKLKVTISKLDIIGGWIEGTFSSTAHTFPPGKVSIKDGIFKLPFQRKITEKK